MRFQVFKNKFFLYKCLRFLKSNARLKKIVSTIFLQNIFAKKIYYITSNRTKTFSNIQAQLLKVSDTVNYTLSLLWSLCK